MNCRLCKAPVRADRDFCDTCVWTVAREVQESQLATLVDLTSAKLQPGQLYTDGDPSAGCFYMLARVSATEFAAVCLTSGNRWTGQPRKSPAEAVKGLTWLAGSITVTTK